jgi:tetratricopeptide (TPR) repeat protein
MQSSKNFNQQLGNGLAKHKQGLLVEAKTIYEQILNSQPDHFDALQLLGIISIQTKDYEKCVDLLNKALQIKIITHQPITIWDLHFTNLKNLMKQ